MSVCANMFKLDAVLVTQTIKKLQVVTRYIQSVCNYSKVIYKKKKNLALG